MTIALEVSDPVKINNSEESVGVSLRIEKIAQNKNNEYDEELLANKVSIISLWVWWKDIA